MSEVGIGEFGTSKINLHDNCSDKILASKQSQNTYMTIDNLSKG